MSFLKKKKISYNSRLMEHHVKFRTKTWWTSSNGRKIKVSELDINHMRNIVNKHERGEAMNFSPEKQAFLVGVIKDELLYRQLNRSSNGKQRN